MKLARLLFKPKWQDKDVTVRRAAVAADHDDELLAALPDLVRTDADAGVRAAALKRLNDYELWRECSTADADPALRKTARAIYIGMLCSADAKVPSLQRRIAELDTLSADEMEKVATNASNRDLRADALSRITRPALLIERTISDPDAQLRLTLIERIDDAAALERIAERARKTDKALNCRAREKLDVLRIGSGDNAAIANKARMLCERIEVLMRSPTASVESELAAIENDWEKLGAAIPQELINRHRGARHVTQQTRQSMLEPKPAPQPQVSAPENPVDPGVVVAGDVSDSLASRTRFDAALAAATERAKRERDQRNAQLIVLEAMASKYSDAIEAGDTMQAKRLRIEIDAGVASIESVPAAIDRRLAPMHARYAELERWLHWSNRQRRDALCFEIESLPTAGLHPDAVATRVRAARDEWKRLDATEGVAGKESDGLARRFHSACHRALKPTRIYFDKRDEVRKSHSEQLRALLARADAIDVANPDWKTLGALRHELGETLRKLDDVDPQERTAFAKRIKHHIATFAPRIVEHEKEIETSKQRLIERVIALTDAADRRETPRAVREFQKQWTALGNGRRSSDQRLWRDFRAACDAAFGKLDAARAEQEAQIASTRAQATEIVEQLEALSSSESVETIRSSMRELDARWQTSGNDDRKLEQRYRQAHDSLARQIRDAARRGRLSRYTVALQKHAELREVENGKTGDASGLQLDDISFAAFKNALSARHAKLQTQQPNADSSDHARDLLVRLEALAHLESPAEDRKRRMDYQVQRLSTRMREGDRADDEHDLTNLMTAWFSLSGSIPSDLESRFDRAARAAIDNLP
jgi:DNA repair protein SbcC/Rad50